VETLPPAPSVLQVVLTLNPGGTERLVLDLVRRLGDRSRQAVCCLDAAGLWGEQLAASGIPVSALERRPGFHPLLARGIARAARDCGATVLHCHQYTPFVYGALSRLARPGLRLVFTEHGRLSDAPASSKRRLVNPWLARAASSIVSVSHDLKRHMEEEGLPGSRIEVVHNGIEVGPPPSRAAAQSVRTELGIPPDAVVVGTVARLDPVKHLQTLLEAVHLCRQRARPVVALLVGDGPERAGLESAARARGVDGEVHFLGHRDDARRYLPAMDVFVNCSVSEGISLTILEAMAGAVPVVATAVGGTPEIVDTTVGRLVPSRDAGALAEAIGALCEQPALRASLGEAARARVVERFTIEAMVNRYFDLYRGVA
jgi:glycosyltransferase involved in cell wall biosynthesis